MFGSLDLEKIAALLVVGLFLFGPDRLPGIAAELGGLLRRLRGMAKKMQADLAAELGPELGELDLRSLHPRTLLQQHLFGEDEDDNPSSRGPYPLHASELPPWDRDAT